MAVYRLVRLAKLLWFINGRYASTINATQGVAYSGRYFANQPSDSQIKFPKAEPLKELNLPTVGQDIDPDSMMYDDSDDESFHRRMLSVDMQINSKDLDGMNIAPIDINPWIIESPSSPDDLNADDGAEEKEIISKVPEPPPPSSRSGVYEFKGLKIMVPKTWLRRETYRYRLTPEDQENLPDDTRILKFD